SRARCISSASSPAASVRTAATSVTRSLGLHCDRGVVASEPTRFIADRISPRDQTARGESRKGPPAFLRAGPFSQDPGGVLLSHVDTGAVPSALKGFTSVFGMGTGGSPSPLPPERISPTLWAASAHGPIRKKQKCSSVVARQ